MREMIDIHTYIYIYPFQTGRHAVTKNIIIVFLNHQQRPCRTLLNIIFRGNQQRTSSTPPPPSQDSFQTINDERCHTLLNIILRGNQQRKSSPPPTHPKTLSNKAQNIGNKLKHSTKHWQAWLIMTSTSFCLKKRCAERTPVFRQKKG